MADSEKGTDGSPLRPVSSLKSHFENMARLKQPSRKAHPAPQLPLPRLYGQRDKNTAERVSLEIPHKPSPLVALGNVVHHERQARVRAPEDQSALAQMDNRSLRRRPISMNSLSSPGSPPIVTINSPLSLPKQFVLPESQLPVQYSATGSYTSNKRPQSPHADPVSPRRSMNTSPIARKGEHPAMTRSNPVQDLESRSGSPGVVHAPSPSSSVAPSVNRAAKPKIPKRRIESGSHVQLESHVTVNSTKVFPFRTTPSSNNNSEYDSAKSRPGSIGIGSHFQPPIIHSYVHPEKGSKVNDLDPTPVIQNNYPKSNSQPFLSHGDNSQSPPGLPRRQEAENNWKEALLPTPVLSVSRTWTEQLDGSQNATIQIKPRIPSANSKNSSAVEHPSLEFMPPPKRPQTSVTPKYFVPETEHRTQLHVSYQAPAVHSPLDDDLPGPMSLNSNKNDMSYPDTSRLNRRPPYFQQGTQTIETHYETRVFDMSTRYICTAGYLTRAWDLFSGDLVMNLVHADKETRVTALAFKPGATLEDEGTRIWLGTNYGDIQEVEIPSSIVLHTKVAAHGRREIVKVVRYQNSLWTLDDDGKLYIWSASKNGPPSLEQIPVTRKVPKGHSCCLVIRDTLWIAAGKDIRVFRPNSEEDSAFIVTKQALNQPGVGDVTSATVIASQLHCVYFGHADGKVTAYSTTELTCLGVFNVSTYRINSLAGVGSYLWAGYNSGVIAVYDTDAQPWSTKKEWQAHEHPVANIVADHMSIWKSGTLRVASIGIDNIIRIWDGMLEQDWLEHDMQDHDIEYCDFRELKAVMITWNAGASTPTKLHSDGRDMKIFQDIILTEACPDLLVFSFQELVDLDDKKLTAKSIFKGNKKKDSSEHEHMSRQYRAWRDFLVRIIEDIMPPNESYQVLHAASMVGLFTCVFVKTSQRSHISNVCTAEVKRGLGGLHGNKGALIIRCVIDNSSVCLVNCHLAAGQSQTAHRNNDVAAILESTILPSERNHSTSSDIYVGGGDGSMILDHEICILNGDLNYRIDTMGRDTVIKAINAKNYNKLLERDQLLVSRRRNPGFRLRAFTESPITFAPTYKYDVGSDKYDTSDKHRSPAWCDRILYRGEGSIKQSKYRRHELQISDHRPVSGIFKLRVKTVSHEKRQHVWNACKQRFESFKQKLVNENR